MGPEETQAFVAACKQHEVGVHGALSAALIRACFSPESKVVPFSHAVNLRSYDETGVAPNHFGCYVDAIGTTLPFHDDFWSLGRVSEEIFGQEMRKKQAIGFLPRNFRRVELEEMAVQAHASCLSGGVAISNLGKLPIPGENETFRIEELYIGTAQPSGIFTLLMTVFSLAGTLYFTFTHTHPLVGSASAETMVTRFFDELESACGNGIQVTRSGACATNPTTGRSGPVT